MTPKSVLLSRIQFAVTVGFHILWPAYTIGVSGFIAIVSALWLRTGNAIYRALLRFWIRLFALGFAMGVVTGLVMSYQIGTNWSVFIDQTSNVIGPFFTYEVLLAFFLEAGFIGIMLFGMDRVGPRLHFLSCLMVAVGAVVSAFWILAANSWMQTPAGFTFVNGRFFVTDWREAIFTPSFPWRFGHMVVAAYIAGSFVVMGVSGYLPVSPAASCVRLEGHVDRALDGARARSGPARSGRSARPQLIPASDRSRWRPWKAIGTRGAASRWCSSPGPTRRRPATTLRSPFHASGASS